MTSGYEEPPGDESGRARIIFAVLVILMVAFAAGGLWGILH
jgi:hypothetical protein